MKRLLELSCVFFLLAGLLIGGILPMPWDQQPAAAVYGNTAPAAGSTSADKVPAFSNAEPLDSQDNFSLLNTACYVVRALEEQDYAAVASVIHPGRGVTFTPYSTVNFETDLTFTREQIEALATDETVYTWGSTDGKGSLINMTMSQYFDAYVCNVDYSQAPNIGVDKIMLSGNALENVKEAYPGCRFVDYSFPGLDAHLDGLDWCSLKLVFQPGDTRWFLVGVVHGEWTI